MSVVSARKRSGEARGGQRGFGAFLLIMFVAVTSSAVAMFTFYRADTLVTNNDAKASDALADAKAALIGYAVRRGAPTGTARPGELPCPDADNDGLEEATCAPGALGRLPWKTLGIPEPRDATGETPWYAVAGPFRTRASNASAINSDTRGNITVLAADGTTQLTTEAVAVIFAPGAAVGSQDRSAGTAACATTGTTIEKRSCAANYLDSVAGTNNAVTNGPYIAGAAGATYNDRVSYVITTEVIPAVELRVGGELMRLLEAYRANAPCMCYPWAGKWIGATAGAEEGQNRGRFPTVGQPHAWGSNGIPVLPAWVAANEWQDRVWYSVSRRNAENEGSLCLTCSSLPRITVGSQTVSALLFTPGTPGTTTDRASASQRSNLALFLDDGQNADGTSTTQCPELGGILGIIGSLLSGATACDTYVKPAAAQLDRDRIFMVGASTPGQCATSSQALLSNAPCHTTGNNVKTECAEAAIVLDACTCMSAGRTMITPPCRNNSNPPQCQAAIAQLQACQS